MESLELLLPPLKMMFRPPGRGEGPSLIDLLPPASRLAIVDPGSVRERLDRIAHNLLGDADRDVLAGAFLRRLEGRPSVRLHSLALEAGSTLPSLSLDFAGADRFQAAELETSMARITGAIAQGSRFTIYCESDAERQRISEILADHAVPSGAGREGPIELRIGAARRGFEVRALGRVFLSSRELFNRRSVRRARRLPAETRVVQSFFDLEEGDIVVHLVHGLGRFLGVVRMEKDGVMQEFLVVEYRDGVKIYVPASKIDLVQKYVGRGEHAPALDRVGGASWSRRKEAVERAIMDYASELLEIQAIRQERPGVAYPSDNDWQRQFEAAFPYDDTPDQRQATLSVKADLQAPRPMDRLLCGDVGYGKTEIAMRAAFKVVQAGKQAVVLVPTTVLAQQHCRTFRERMAGFPFRIEQLSRFSTAREQKETIEAARRGQVDILIGTHRVLSDDVGFQDLGLVVIDEEQRFGVGHKEKLKRLRAMVDILTLTATPIPRTLHLSLLGIRDISSLTTPPEGRSPISTDVIEFDRRVIRDATLRELNREGQVYFVHNRVQDIHLVCHQLQQLVPEARIEHAHGQMSERELEDIMMRFLDRRVDVLVSTTIIETGIDIPNVNTIFVNECDRYGLADLHQLRGRVGRSRHRAYCYLILPEHRHVNPDARKRIQAIREFSQLGAGFQIAMRDLEIRGAGNILGAEQSGHIAVVGYDLYCRLLEKAVKGLQGEEAQKAVDVEIDLNLEAYIPEDVIRDEGARLEVYRRVSKAQEVKALDELLEEFRDRFGAPTPPVERLFDVQRLRILAARAGLRSLRYDEDSIIIGGGERMRPLLDACPLRVVVLDPGHLALVVNDPRRRRSLPLNDELVFRSMLEWLEHGRLPSPLGGRMAVAGRS
jgi:transcription-repair coupling factor (superfamily II helicase)